MTLVNFVPAVRLFYAARCEASRSPVRVVVGFQRLSEGFQPRRFLRGRFLRRARLGVVGDPVPHQRLELCSSEPPSAHGRDARRRGGFFF